MYWRQSLMGIVPPLQSQSQGADKIHDPTDIGAHLSVGAEPTAQPHLTIR